jgi:shikimate dehydrogenase
VLARRCAVLGSPIAHSLSPVMHRAAYARLGLDWRYDAYDVDEVGLPVFLDGLDASWRGLSLTMPLKRAVLPLLDAVSDTARAAGGANTVLLDDSGRSGDNTDVPGIVAALAERGVSGVTSATVVGAGATAESFVVALRRIGLESVRLVVRDPARAEGLRARAAAAGLDVVVRRIDDDEPIDDVDLLVSTVPATTVEPLAEQWVSHSLAVFDAIYDPWPTPLLQAASTAGRTAASGIDLLAHQAVLQVALMTGRDLPVDAVRNPALAALGSRP